jgi:CRP-like cAMP-binding protein
VHVVRLLDEDPDLGAGLEPARFEAARADVRAVSVPVARGRWEDTEWPQAVRQGLGLLVLEGLLIRGVELDERRGAELLTTGDLLRPWQREDAVASVPRRSAWEVIRPARIAVLDLDFVRRVEPYPELVGQLVGRGIRRSRHLAVNMAIVHQPKVDKRVHMLLWDLADRCGTRRRDGVFVPLRLTHEVLAALVAARRPTVSVALGSLERDGLVERVDGGWLLSGPPPGALGAVLG